MKEMETIRRLLAIASLCMIVPGVIFLGLSIFGPDGGTRNLSIALGCVCLSTLFNVIRLQLGRK